VSFQAFSLCSLLRSSLGVERQLLDNNVTEIMGEISQCGAYCWRNVQCDLSDHCDGCVRESHIKGREVRLVSNFHWRYETVGFNFSYCVSLCFVFIDIISNSLLHIVVIPLVSAAVSDYTSVAESARLEDAKEL
jgi:hypothetical protein